MRRLLPALMLALAALPAQAQVYKWVDSKGQINYSNAPPASVAGKAQVVEEQISIMGMDPAVRAWAEQRFAAQERQEERDWQQRQHAMSLQPASAMSLQPESASYGGYSGDYYSPYYGAGQYYGGYVRRPFHNRVIGSKPPRVVHHAPRVMHHTPRVTHHASRAGARR